MDPKCPTTLVSFCESARSRASLDSFPKRASVFTGRRPNYMTNCSQVWYFVLIEREARPHLDLTPVTSRRPSLLSPLSSVPPCLPSFPKVLSFDLLFCLSVLSQIICNVQQYYIRSISFVITELLCRPSRVDKP